MAIAFDVASGLQSNSGTVHTFAHTCSGSNRLLVVFVMCASSRTVNSVTYGGVAMTFKTKTSGPSQNIHIYHLVAPATGSNNVVVTIDSSSFCYPTAVSYTGVDQTTPTGNSVAQNGSTATVTLTTTVDNAIIVAGARDANDGSTSAGANATQRYSVDTQAYDRLTTGSSGSYALTISGVSSGNDSAIAGMVVNPSSAPPSSVLHAIERSPIRGVMRGVCRP